MTKKSIFRDQFSWKVRNFADAFRKGCRFFCCSISQPNCDLERDFYEQDLYIIGTAHHSAVSNHRCIGAVAGLAENMGRGLRFLYAHTDSAPPDRNLGESIIKITIIRTKKRIMKTRILSIVTLLLMAVTGAMAQTEALLTTITATGKEQASYSPANVATVSFSYTAGGSSAYLANWGWWGYGWSATVTAAEGYTITKCVFYDDQNRTATDSEAPFVVETTEEDKTPQVNGTPILAYTSKGIKKIEVYGYATPTVTLSEATDNSTTLTTYDGQVANVTLTRTLQTGGWNTFCVPFSTATPTGWTVKELTASDFNSSTGALSLTFGNAASIVAGTPYLVKVTSNVVNPTFDGVTINKTAVPFTSTNVDFIPTLGLTEITGDDANDILFLGSGNTLLHPTALPANMKGFRAYFQLKGDAALARSFSMDFGDGETTGIITIENGQSATDKAIYDLQGRRVNGTAQKGVYVVNGRKVIIK